MSIVGPPIAGEREPQAKRRIRPDAKIAVEDLVAQAQAGDHAAFHELVNQTQHMTYTLAYRLTMNHADACDVTQDAYVRAYRGLGGFRAESEFSTWLYRITANCASSYLKRHNKHRHVPLEEVGDPAATSGLENPELRLDATELGERISDALRDFPPKLRAVIVLRDMYGMDHAAIAEELGISVSAAKVRLHRARTKLRSQVFPDLTEVSSRAL